MNEEIRRILKMVEEGKIDSEKAAQLIEAFSAPKATEVLTGGSDKMLKIRVNAEAGDNVNINIPVKFLNILGTAIKRLPKVQGVEGIEDIDIQAILQAVGNGLEGKIVDVKSGNGDTVEVVVE